MNAKAVYRKIAIFSGLASQISWGRRFCRKLSGPDPRHGYWGWLVVREQCVFATRDEVIFAGLHGFRLRPLQVVIGTRCAIV